MSPYEIDVLLWYHCRCVDHPDRLRVPPVWNPTIEKFFRDGLITHSENKELAYELTEKGHFYVTEGLCKVPLPVSEWHIPK